jgi:hypothetical protein
MAKFPTFPTLYDEVIQLKISKLKEWGYINDSVKGVMRWGSNGENTGSISIQSNISIENSYIDLDYKYNGEPINYKVKLITVPSNLGRGDVWYFLCPYTNKRCRKLYLLSGYFMHRESMPGCMYDSQTKSKKWRNMASHYNKVFDAKEAIEQLYSKHFRSHYAGKPTKRYLKLIKRIEM